MVFFKKVIGEKRKSFERNIKDTYIRFLNMFLLLSGIFSMSLGLPLNDTASIESLERGQRSILNLMGHVTVWRFPQGPMTLGCLIMAAGIALGVCMMCVWMHFQWQEMTQGAASAIQEILRNDRQLVNYSSNLYTPLSALPSYDDSSVAVQATEMDTPPSYDEVI